MLRLVGLFQRSSRSPSLGCGIVDSDEERVIGFVDASSLWCPVIVLPDTAEGSEPLPLTVWTTGGGCTREGDTEVVVSEGTVRITPFDIVTRADACLTSQEYFAHQVSVELTDRGTGAGRPPCARYSRGRGG